MTGRHVRQTVSRPTLSQMEAALEQERYASRYRRALRGTLSALVTAAAIAVLVATLMLPVLRIYGGSMTPTLEDGDVVASVRAGQFRRGDVVAFYYNNKILIKRVIALPGEWVDIDESGAVSVDGQTLDEPYVSERALGGCDIALPYQVPEGRLFVMGDHRDVSVDSRSAAVGCVSEEQIVGRLVLRIWPLADFGTIQ